MGHESDPSEPGQTTETSEWPQPSEREITEAEQEERARQVYERDRRQEELIDSTERMIEISKANEAKSSTAEVTVPAPSFEAPPEVQAELDEQARIFSAEYDRLDDQSRSTGGQILEDLAKKGITRPKTAEEIEAEEVAAINTHATKVHKPRPKKSKTLWRPKSSIQRDIADNDQKAKTERELRGDI